MAGLATGWPFASVTVAVKRTVSPTSTDAVAGVTWTVAVGVGVGGETGAVGSSALPHAAARSAAATPTAASGGGTNRTAPHPPRSGGFPFSPVTAPAPTTNRRTPRRSRTGPCGPPTPSRRSAPRPSRQNAVARSRSFAKRPSPSESRTRSAHASSSPASSAKCAWMSLYGPKCVATIRSGFHVITLSMLAFQSSTSMSGGGVTGIAGPPRIRMPPTSPTQAVPCRGLAVGDMVLGVPGHVRHLEAASPRRDGVPLVDNADRLARHG